MAKVNYIACANKPEELEVCTALDVGDYPIQYAEKVKSILGNIQDDGLRKIVKSTLGGFESGSDGKLAQSSPYRLVILNEILPEGKVLVARPRLQIAKLNDPDFMSWFYVDFGLNLVGKAGYITNPIQAEALAEDLREAGFDLTTPKLIPYNVLRGEVYSESPSGLVFRLSEQGKDNAKSSVLNTPDFEWNYLPTNNGLFRACLDGNGGWDADDGLGGSSGGGRVVVETTGGASAKNLEELRSQTIGLLDRQKKEREDLVARLRA